MCGITGFVDFENDVRLQAEFLSDMLKEVSRRGPDQSGTYITDTAALAHARLTVIDRENGRQPMTARSGGKDYTVVYNGELYNTDEVRRELAGRGHAFAGRSDTEVLLRAYTEWGGDCLERLNGIFAFAVWDGETLFAARDRLGVKPFFYMLRKNKILFASEIKALFKHPDAPRVIDEFSLAEVVLLGPGTIPGSGVYKGVKELKPGHYAVFSREGFFMRRYWKLTARPHAENFKETAECVRRLVIDAVKRQTVSDVPLCSFLSGGLDSSSIASISGVKHTFSVDYRDNSRYFKASKFQPSGDAEYAAKMAKYLKTEHVNVVLEPDALAAATDEAYDARDLPGMADVDGSLLLFCREVKKTHTVALSGECADEWAYI